MLFFNTLNKEKWAIILYLSNTMFVGLYYYFLYDTNNLIYPLVLTLFFLIIYIGYKYMVYRKLYVQINESKKSPGYKIDKNSDFDDVIEEINNLHSKYIKKIYDMECSNEERENLLVEWIHNMKTSVAVIELASNKLPEDSVKNDIIEESNLLRENLEGALNIFRLDEFNKDYVPEVINLNSFIKEIVNEKKRSFIYSGVFPKIDIDKDINILSDKKWGKYIIDQLLGNGIKYSNKGDKILITEEHNDDKVTLYIKDSGIGIKKSELGRVFDAFYTGSNGRIGHKSSGVGLYMCKNICDRINSNITIKSEEGIGTIVEVTFLKYTI